jgi:hypothetical protein
MGTNARLVLPDRDGDGYPHAVRPIRHHQRTSKDHLGPADWTGLGCSGVALPRERSAMEGGTMGTRCLTHPKACIFRSRIHISRVSRTKRSRRKPSRNYASPSRKATSRFCASVQDAAEAIDAKQVSRPPRRNRQRLAVQARHHGHLKALPQRQGHYSAMTKTVASLCPWPAWIQSTDVYPRERLLSSSGHQRATPGHAQDRRRRSIREASFDLPQVSHTILGEEIAADFVLHTAKAGPS